MTEASDIHVSSETLERMKSELEELTTTGRAQTAERLQRAREFGDLKENSEYHSAKDAQGLMEARIRQLQHMIKVAVVRESAASADKAIPGTIVVVRDGDDTSEYLLALTNEEKLPGMRTVTTNSPLGSALLGKRVGQSAEIKAPGGSFSVQIVELRPA